MRETIRSAFLVLALELFIAFVCPQALLAGSTGSTTTEIEPGTVINEQNWQRYRNFMSEGLAALFQGDHFWHLPADLRIQVGPTISIPLPKKYLEDTSRYSSQVRLQKTAFGGYVPMRYVAGLPFPHPLEGDPSLRGQRIFWNSYYRYQPRVQSAPTFIYSLDRLPTMGKWEVRGTYVISLRRLPLFAEGYCYSRRVMYVDKET